MCELTLKISFIYKSFGYITLLLLLFCDGKCIIYAYSYSNSPMCASVCDDVYMHRIYKLSAENIYSVWWPVKHYPKLALTKIELDGSWLIVALNLSWIITLR